MTCPLDLCCYTALTKLKDNSMKVIIHLNGTTFETVETNVLTAMECKDKIYKTLKSMKKMEFQTKPGWLILGKIALQGAILEFLD